jgi:hypothetical protein
MTEAEWQDCTDEYEMLRTVRSRKSPWQWTTRKARLFGCACCRRAWHALTEPAQRTAVEMAERVADKQLRPSDLTACSQAATSIHLGVDPSAVFGGGGWSRCSRGNWCFSVQFSPEREMLCNPARGAATPRAWPELYFTANDVRALLHFRVGVAAARAEERVQCDLLRDLTGPPRPLPALPAALLNPTVLAIAQAAYDERILPSGELDRNRLAVLADALEEASCTDPQVLGHLRGPGLHIRGCFLVDALLGKR